MRRLMLALTILAPASARAHDVPNARVDRAIQVTVRAGSVAIDYEVSLSELTLTQDLRALTGALPGLDRRAWLDRYGEAVGPLNAEGLLVAVDGRPVALRGLGFEVVVEDHARYTFHYEGPIPPRGRLSVRDTNYEAGEGTSRLAARAGPGVEVVGDSLPTDVALIPARPLWELTDDEEGRTKHVEVDYRPGGLATTPAVAPPTPPAPPEKAPANGLSRLLDRSAAPGVGLFLIAFALGAAHAIQPGHGKSLVAAASMGTSGGWARGALLAAVVTLTHVGGVLAIAAALWATRGSQYQDVDAALAHAAGFVIAAVGLWRLGRHLGGHGEHADEPDDVPPGLGLRSLIGLGLAGGIVPCWDAVVLILLAEAVGRLLLGTALLASFSLGMGTVLLAVALAATRLRAAFDRRDPDGRWSRRLGLLSASAVALIGISIMVL